MPDPTPRRLTPRQKRFCEEYVTLGSAVLAYFAAFGRDNKHAQKRSYAGAAQCAKRLKALPRVAAEIESCRRDARRRANVGRGDLLRLHAETAALDVAEFFEEEAGEPVPIPPYRLPARVRRCVRGFEVKRRKIKSPSGDAVLHETEEIKYLFHDAQKARDSLAKMLGVDAPTTPLDKLLEQLSPALRQQVAAELAAVLKPG